MTNADIELKDYEKVLTLKLNGMTFPLFVLMERFVKIMNKDSQIVPFRLNDTQIYLYKTICEQKMLGKPIYFNVLKGRQFGITTFLAAMYAVEVFFGTNTKVGIIADTKEHAGDILATYTFIYDHLDDDNPNRDEDGQIIKGASFKPQLKYNKGKSFIQTAHNNSIIRVMAQGDQAGRSYHYDKVHLSEGAYFDQLKLTLLALLQTISQTNSKSMVFIESTANGMNEFHDLFYSHLKGDSSFKPVFLAWFNHKEYEVDNEFVPSDLETWEIEKFDKYLSHFEPKERARKINWYHNQYLTSGLREKDYMLQEYPFGIEDAFINSGNSYFNLTLISDRREEVMETKPIFAGRFKVQHAYSLDGSLISINNIDLLKHDKEIIKFYEEPIKGHPYVVVADPNEGGKDNSAVVVMNNHTTTQAAVLYSNEIDNEELAYQIYALGKYYNDALVSPENNRGAITLRTLMKTQYPNIYLAQKQDYESRDQKYSNKYGHNLSVATRTPALEEFKLAFKQNPNMIRDFDTLIEMSSFNLVEHYSRDGTMKGTKIEASNGGKDDIVMAIAGFFIVRNQKTTLVEGTLAKYDALSWLNNMPNSDKGGFIEW